MRKKAKDMSNMSDQDLRERVNRLNMEEQYSKLTSKEMSKGQRYVKNTLEVVGPSLAITSSALAIALAIKQMKG